MSIITEKAESRERLDKPQTEMKRTSPSSSVVGNEKCANCRFYIDGYCQRFPPVVVAESGTATGYWPAVGANNWCGEWKKKP